MSSRSCQVFVTQISGQGSSGGPRQKSLLVPVRSEARRRLNLDTTPQFDQDDFRTSIQTSPQSSSVKRRAAADFTVSPSPSSMKVRFPLERTRYETSLGFSIRSLCHCSTRVRPQWYRGLDMNKSSKGLAAWGFRREGFMTLPTY